MNKAFTKEQEADQGHCPQCGSLGTPVRPETLAAHLTEEQRQQLSEPAYFCGFPKCDAVYFDAFERTIGQAALKSPVYPKDPAGPICSCFGLTVEDVEEDVREGVVTRVKGLLEKAKSPQAQCATRAPSGQCCAPEVQRYYMKVRAAWGGG